jgi:hypothetical protein
MENNQHDYLPDKSKLIKKIDLEFDYELNDCKLEESKEVNNILYFINKNTQEYGSYLS